MLLLTMRQWPMTGGMKYDIELPNASCIIEVDKAGGWVGNNIIFLNAGIAFFVWLLSVFAVKKWLENKEAHREDCRQGRNTASDCR